MLFSELTGEDGYLVGGGELGQADDADFLFRLRAWPDGKPRRLPRLDSVALPDAVRRIESEAFADCAALEEIEFPEGLEEIGDNAFRECRSLSEVRLPGGLRELGGGAFLGCSDLRHVHLPESLEVIGDEAFAECSSLETVTLPGSLQSIGASCFRDCRLLREAVIPEGVTEIQDGTFVRCPRLEKLSLPASIRRVSSMAAFSSDELHTVIFRGKVPGMMRFEDGIRVHAGKGLLPVKTLLSALPAFASHREEFTAAEVQQYADSVRTAAWELREIMLEDEAVFCFAEEYRLMDSSVVQWLLQQAAEHQRTELAARLLEYQSKQNGAAGPDLWDL